MLNTLFLFLADAAPAAAKTAQQQQSGLGMLPYIIGFFVIFYFMLLRPQAKKQKAQQALIRSAKTGDQILTTGGIYGLITNTKEQTVTVKIADSVKVELDRSAIATVVKPANDAASAPTA